MLFDVTLSDGSVIQVQAHNRAQVEEALKYVVFTKSEENTNIMSQAEQNRQMKITIVKQVISALDGMIAIFGQAAVLTGKNDKEREAEELLKDARLKLVEDLENRNAPGWEIQ